jgi:hypothetical protein
LLPREIRQAAMSGYSSLPLVALSEESEARLPRLSNKKRPTKWSTFYGKESERVNESDSKTRIDNRDNNRAGERERELVVIASSRRFLTLAQCSRINAKQRRTNTKS